MTSVDEFLVNLFEDPENLLRRVGLGMFLSESFPGYLIKNLGSLRVRLKEKCMCDYYPLTSNYSVVIVRGDDGLFYLPKSLIPKTTTEMLLRLPKGCISFVD